MWHDYFKPEHLEKFPDLHDVCWKASKQASQVKRTVDLEEAKKLLGLIDQIDEMWKGTNGPATTRLPRLIRLAAALAGAVALLILVLRSVAARRMRRSWAAACRDRGRQHGPTLEPGDWLLVDPTGRRWPRPGSVVVFREPGERPARDQASRGALRPRARGTGRPGVGAGRGVARSATTTAHSRNSRAFGPVGFDRYVGRAWFRYGPIRRLGLLAGVTR